jgi:hypothetical protein
VQGIMAALSAGLLVYAGCVEMLAADFVLAAGPDTLATARPARRALALGSLLAGAAGMAVLGCVFRGAQVGVGWADVRSCAGSGSDASQRVGGMRIRYPAVASLAIEER